MSIGPIRADFVREGAPTPLTLSCEWAEDAALDQARTTGTPPAHWAGALANHRPLLPHSELGARLDGKPTELYDSVAGMLGLEELTDAVSRLRTARLDRGARDRQTAAALKELRPELQGSDDDRARQAAAALARRPWRLDDVELILEGAVDGADPAAELAILGRLAQLAPPPAEAVVAAAERLDTALATLAAAREGDGQRAHRLATVLDEALHIHPGEATEACAVCGTVGAVDAAWRARAEEQLGHLRAASREQDRARDALDAAAGEARALLGTLPPQLAEGARIGVATAEVDAAWGHWCDAPADAQALADHLRRHHAPLDRAAAALRELAAAELQRRDDAWRPLARRLMAWLPQARAAEAARTLTDRVAEAEGWLREHTDRLRDERFAPIAADARQNWELLRQQSSISLDELGLAGTANQRRLALGVRVDGVEGSALGVMSQGELNSLALSLFLPRATAEESPFRFMVIDDPVQSMDPAKVDGLARVLERAARTHQVVVFTHDERLPEAVGRLAIPATVLEVARGADSQVEVRAVAQPWSQALEDARAAMRDENLPLPIARRVVPGLCRQAIEAACGHLAAARLHRAGLRHHEVAEVMGRANTLMQRLALATLGDSGRSGDVYRHLNSRFGGWAADTARAVNEAGHTGTGGDLQKMADDTRRLAQRLVAEAA